VVRRLTGGYEEDFNYEKLLRKLHAAADTGSEVVCWGGLFFYPHKTL
jgi:hypothetical protein